MESKAGETHLGISCGFLTHFMIAMPRIRELSSATDQFGHNCFLQSLKYAFFLFFFFINKWNFSLVDWNTFLSILMCLDYFLISIMFYLREKLSINKANKQRSSKMLWEALVPQLCLTQSLLVTVVEHEQSHPENAMFFTDTKIHSLITISLS